MIEISALLWGYGKMMNFPEELRGKENWNNSLTANWSTATAETASGRMRTLTTQLYPKWTFTLNYPHLTDAQADLLQGFVNQCRGSGSFFWYKDYQRYRMEAQELPKTASGKFQFVCNIGGFNEPVLNVDNVTVYKNGAETTAYTITGGLLSISAGTNDVITASYDYYLKCYIADDGCTIQRQFINSNTASITLGVAR